MTDAEKVADAAMEARDLLYDAFGHVPDPHGGKGSTYWRNFHAQEAHDLLEGALRSEEDMTDEQMTRATKVFLNEARFVDEPDVCNETLAENAVFKILQARKERSHD